MGNLVWLDSNDNKKVYQVAKLHKELLTDSPIPQLGDLFMTEFYYKRLINAGLINCLTYIYKSKVVGFIVVTKYPGKFMSKGLVKYFFFVIYISSRLIIRKPNIIFTLFKVIKVGYRRNIAKIGDKVSELLSIGIKSNYRKVIDQSSGLRISHVLYCNAAMFLKREGYKTFQVITDKNNKRAISFYKKYNEKSKKVKYSDREKQILFKLDLRKFDIDIS